MTSPIYLPSESGILFEANKDASGLFRLNASPNPFASMLGLIRDDRGSNDWALELTGIWMVSSDYMVPMYEGLGVTFNPLDFRNYLLMAYTRDELLVQLAALNHLQSDSNVVDQVLTYIQPLLSVKLFETIKNIQDPHRPEPHRLLTRTTILRAMRLVSDNSPINELDRQEKISQGHISSERFDLLLTALMLVHATGDMMNASNHVLENDEDSTFRFAGLPKRLAMELLCSGAATRDENVGNLIGRTRMLYREYANRVSKYSMPLAIDLFIEEALGMPLDDLLCIGFAIWSKSQVREDVQSPLGISFGTFLDHIPEESVSRFMELYSQTSDDLSMSCKTSSGDWQVHPIQEKPLIIIDGAIFILDEQYLIECFTKGVYWRLHDHSKLAYSEEVRATWNQFYGEMHELLVEDYLEPFALPIIGSNEKTIFYEEDLQLAFVGKAIDVGIDFSSSVLIADAQSGQLTRKTIETGNLEQFARDLEKIAGGKLIQLEETSKNLLADPQPTNSPLQGPAKKIYPVIISGGVFPSSPITDDYISDRVRTLGYFQDARIQTLKILDLRDLEEAEGSRIRDHSTLVDIIERWQSSQYSKNSLSDWIRVTDRAASRETLRSERIVTAIEESIEVIYRKLQITTEEETAL